MTPLPHEYDGNSQSESSHTAVRSEATWALINFRLAMYCFRNVPNWIERSIQIKFRAAYLSFKFTASDLATSSYVCSTYWLLVMHKFFLETFVIPIQD